MTDNASDRSRGKQAVPRITNEDRLWKYIEDGEAWRREQMQKIASIEARLTEIERWQKQFRDADEKREAFNDKLRQMIIGSVTLSALGTLGAFLANAVWESLRRQ